MLIPPFHFSIVSSPLLYPTDAQILDTSKEVLYRGSIPAERNISFIRSKRIKTVVYLRKDEIGSREPLSIWAGEQEVELRWIKAEVMGEEKLGLGKNEVGEVIKTILDRSKYPLYIADVDGISHTTLIVACLRKLQGWHMDSILDEIVRFEPDHEDYSLIPFITSYLSSSDNAFVLPPPPYPFWLWPSPPQPTVPLSTRRERDRTKSESSVSPKPLLPFPHPLQAKRHPTMRLTYPNTASPLLPALQNNSLSRVSTRADKDDRSSPLLVGSPPPGLTGATLDHSSSDMGSPSSRQGKAVNFSRTSTFDRVLSIQAVMDSPETMPMSRYNTITSSVHTGSTDSADEEAIMSPEEVVGDEYEEGEGEDVEDEDMEDDEDEDEEEEEEEEEEDLQPQSQYISALDLAGT